MGLLKSTKLFCNVSQHCDAVANSVMSSMRYEGYEVDGVKQPSGDWDISIRKGDVFISNTEKILEQFEKDDEEWGRRGRALGIDL